MRTSQARRHKDDPTTAYARDVVNGRSWPASWCVMLLSGICGTCRTARSADCIGDRRRLRTRWGSSRRASRSLPAPRPANRSTFCHGIRSWWGRSSAGSKDSGRLRFRRGWLETGKGQAKSPADGGDRPLPDGLVRRARGPRSTPSARTAIPRTCCSGRDCACAGRLSPAATKATRSRSAAKW